MTVLLSTTAVAAEVGRLWRVAVTGRIEAPPPVPLAPTPEPAALLHDRLKDARTSTGTTWCPDCDVTWKGEAACFACGTEPSTKP